MSIAEDITSSLDSTASHVSTWKSLRLAVLYHWDEKKLEERTKGLSNIRNELQFNVVISMEAQVDVLALKESSALQALDKQIKTMVKAVLTGDIATNDALRDLTAALNKKLKDNQRQLAQQIDNSNALAYSIIKRR